MFGEQKIVEFRVQGMFKEVSEDEGTRDDWMVNF